VKASRQRKFTPFVCLHWLSRGQCSVLRIEHCWWQTSKIELGQMGKRKTWCTEDRRGMGPPKFGTQAQFISGDHQRCSKPMHDGHSVQKSKVGGNNELNLASRGRWTNKYYWILNASTYAMRKEERVNAKKEGWIRKGQWWMVVGGVLLLLTVLTTDKIGHLLTALYVFFLSLLAHPRLLDLSRHQCQP